MPSPALVIDRDGEQYAVPVAAYRDTYAGLGFRPVAYEDGTPFEGDRPKAKTKADLLADAEAAGIAVPKGATKAQIEVALAHGAVPDAESTEPPAEG